MQVSLGKEQRRVVLVPGLILKSKQNFTWETGFSWINNLVLNVEHERLCDVETVIFVISSPLTIKAFSVVYVVIDGEIGVLPTALLTMNAESLVIIDCTSITEMIG